MDANGGVNLVINCLIISFRHNNTEDAFGVVNVLRVNYVFGGKGGRIKTNFFPERIPHTPPVKLLAEPPQHGFVIRTKIKDCERV